LEHSVRLVFEGKTPKGAEVLLRYPEPGDLRALWEFINALSREQTYLLLQGEEISWEDEQHYLNRQLEAIGHNQAVQLLAFTDGRLIGNVDVSVGDGLSQKHVGGLGIAVAQEARGMGVGRLLMETVISEAANNLPGLQMITLQVFGNNATAIALYESLGFREFGRLPRAYKHRDQYVDGVYMVKPLS
jgi:ribosomal protein S18 acetylase RimI-like enzyme